MTGKKIKICNYYLNHLKKNQILEKLEGKILELKKLKSAMPRRDLLNCILPSALKTDKTGEKTMRKRDSPHKTSLKDQVMISLIRLKNIRSDQSILPTIEAICLTQSKKCIQT